MELLIFGFFGLFFLISMIAIIFKLYSIASGSHPIKIELYDDGKYSTNLSELCTGRLADTSIRSSVRLHNSMYKTKNNYEKYRKEILNKELP